MQSEIKIKIMNFGNWIFVAFVLFALFIGALVTICVREDVDLVSKSYYNDELAYQDQIKRINNTYALVTKPAITRVSNNIVQIAFSKQFNIERGGVKFFCPSNPENDKDFIFQPSKNVQQFDTSYLQRGMYKAKFLWVMEGKEYYYEEIIYI
jgi:hypothetical protein